MTTPPFLNQPFPTFIDMSNKIMDLQQKASNTSAQWNTVTNNYKDLKMKVATLAPLETKTMGVQSANVQSLKMQKQKDIVAQMEQDNNILILTGVGLVIAVLCAITLYQK